MAQTELLPQGIIDNFRRKGVLPFLRQPKPEETWETQWGEKEKTVRLVFEKIVEQLFSRSLSSFTLSLEIRAALDRVDEKTGLTQEQLIALGYKDIGSGRAVIIPHTRLGLAGKTKGDFLAKGGDFSFRIQYGSPVARQAEGKFIGVILNAETDVQIKDGRVENISLPQLNDVLGALVAVHKCVLSQEQSGGLDGYLDQRALDQMLVRVISES